MQFDSGCLGKEFESATEVDAFHLHREVKNVAVKIANVAAVALSNGVYGEAGFFVVVPRAQAEVVWSTAAQIDLAADEVNEVGSLFDAIFGVEVGTDWHGNN